MKAPRIYVYIYIYIYIFVLYLIAGTAILFKVSEIQCWRDIFDK